MCVSEQGFRKRKQDLKILDTSDLVTRLQTEKPFVHEQIKVSQASNQLVIN